MHALIMHTYNSDNADLRVDHLGLHKALCILMGWNFSKPPDNSKTYQFLPADEAAANQDDLILWPPLVIIHNTITGKGRDGRMEGLGNKIMDSKIRGTVRPSIQLSSVSMSLTSVRQNSIKLFACMRRWYLTAVSIGNTCAVLCIFVGLLGCNILVFANLWFRMNFCRILCIGFI